MSLRTVSYAAAAAAAMSCSGAASAASAVSFHLTRLAAFSHRTLRTPCG